MMFILDEIQCVVEEALMFVEEKVALWQEERAIKRMIRSEDEQGADENAVEEDEIEDESLDDFDEYLRECALGVLFPFGMPKDDELQGDGKRHFGTSEVLGAETQKELKTIIQSMASKLSEEDKKEIAASLKNKDLGVDVNELLGVHNES